MKGARFAIAAAAMAAAVSVRAADIVVNPPAEGLANGGLESALAKALPGDRVVLRAGEYRLDGPVAFPRGGEEGRPITLCSAPGEYVALLGSVRLTGWEKHRDNIWKAKHPPKLIKGLYEDSERLTHPRPDWGKREDPPLEELKAPGTWTQDDQWVYLWSRESDSPDNHRIEASQHVVMNVNKPWVRVQGLHMLFGQHVVCEITADDCEVVACEIAHCSNSVDNSYNAYFSGCSHSAFRNCRMHDSYYWGDHGSNSHTMSTIDCGDRGPNFVEGVGIMGYIINTAALIACLAGISAAEEQVRTPERYVRLGHYQCVCRQGDFEANLQTVIRGLELAADARVQILSFPESFLNGYFRKREDAEKHSFAIDSPEMRTVLERTARFDIVFMVGFNERRGEKIANTVAVIERGKILGTYSKAFPGMYFEPGREFPVFERHGLKFGLVICADGGYIEPARILALKGARVIFAPHFNFVNDPLEHYQTVRSDHIARAVENGVYFIRGNNCTRERQMAGLADDGHGYGESYVLNPSGQVVAGAGLYDECLMLYNLDLNKQYRVGDTRRSRESARALLETLEQTLRETR